MPHRKERCFKILSTMIASGFFCLQPHAQSNCHTTWRNRTSDPAPPTAAPSHRRRAAAAPPRRPGAWAAARCPGPARGRDAKASCQPLERFPHTKTSQKNKETFYSKLLKTVETLYHLEIQEYVQLCSTPHLRRFLRSIKLSFPPFWVPGTPVFSTLAVRPIRSGMGGREALPSGLGSPNLPPRRSLRKCLGGWWSPRRPVGRRNRGWCWGGGRGRG